MDDMMMDPAPEAMDDENMMMEMEPEMMEEDPMMGEEKKDDGDIKDTTISYPSLYWGSDASLLLVLKDQ